MRFEKLFRGMHDNKSTKLVDKSQLIRTTRQFYELDIYEILLWKIEGDGKRSQVKQLEKSWNLQQEDPKELDRFSLSKHSNSYFMKSPKNDNRLTRNSISISRQLTRKAKLHDLDAIQANHFEYI